MEKFSDGAAKVIMGNRGEGKSSVVKGNANRSILGSPEHGRGTAGTRRFDLGSKSLNRGRKI